MQGLSKHIFDQTLKLWHTLLALSHKSPPNFIFLISQLKALFTFNVKCSLSLQIWSSKCNLFRAGTFYTQFGGFRPRFANFFIYQELVLN